MVLKFPFSKVKKLFSKFKSKFKTLSFNFKPKFTFLIIIFSLLSFLINYFLFIIISGTTASATNSTTSTTTTCAPTGGPPILDIETANRVIENALSGSISNQIAHGESAFNSELITGHINSVIEQHSKEMRLNEIANQRDDQHEQSSLNSGNSNAHLKASTSNNSATRSISSSSSKITSSSGKITSSSGKITSSSSKITSSSSKTTSHQNKQDDNDEVSTDDEKPLNLSSSTVLHTSNQHIIDHFIEKMLNTGTEGNKVVLMRL